MKKLTSTQKMMCKKVLSLFKSGDDIKTIQEIHDELIGEVNFSINSTYSCFIYPLIERGYLDMVSTMYQQEKPLRKWELVRCY